ncbi:MAG: sigma-70 family RNA polymerase sigma factor [Chitinophagaceae bacterium]
MTPLSSYHEEELLRLLLQDDRQAFEELYRRYWEPLFNTAYKRLRSTEQSKDVIQDVFTDLWVRRHTSEINNLSAYLHTAVRYQVFKIIAKGKAAASFFELFESIASFSFSADNKVAEEELAAVAQAWLESLPGKRKEIVVLHLVQNLTTKEIADRLHISQKTVQNQLGSARKSFLGKINSFLA